MEQLRSPKLGRKRSRLFWTVLAGSVLAHGVVLGLPWPATEISQEPLEPATEAESDAAIDVAILPTETLKPPVEESVDQTDEVAAVEESPTRLLERSPQPLPEPLSTPQPPPPSPEFETPPTPSPATEPITPIPNPVDELPPEPGSANPIEPTPPTLEERLRDVSEYQHDGTKNLGDDTFVEAQNWAVAGQIFPEKAPTLELPYELGATCLDNPPLRGTLMVVTDEVGNFARGPEVISSTGYDVLDEQAADFIRTGQYRLPEENESKAYSVDIEVLYPNTCL